MHDLEVDGQFLTAVIEHKDAKATTTVVECIRKSVKQAALVQDSQALLDIACFRHGDDRAVRAYIEDTVLLEDGA